MDVTGGAVRSQISRTNREDAHQLDLLQTILETHSLTDAYRLTHSHGTDTTHKNSAYNRSSRLDRIYAPTSHFIPQFKHLPEALKFTDHKAIIATIDTTQTRAQSKRSPHWKFNNTLLQNKFFVDTLTKLIQNYTNDIPTDNIQQYWEILKNTIRHTTQKLATRIHRDRLQRQKMLEEAIRLTKQVNNDAPIIHILQEELEKLQQHTFQGALLRTKLNTITQEQPTRQFLAIEQNVQRSRQIAQIVDS